MAASIEELSLGEGGALSDGDNAALGADGTARFRQSAMIGNLELERCVALAGFHAGMHGASHDGVEQRGRVAAMDDTEPIIDRLRRRRFEHDKPLLRRNGVKIELLDDSLVAVRAGE